MLNEDELRESILLVFANKQDLPNAMSAAEMTDKLGLHGLRQRQWYARPPHTTITHTLPIHFSTRADSIPSFAALSVESPSPHPPYVLSLSQVHPSVLRNDRRWTLRGLRLALRHPPEEKINIEMDGILEAASAPHTAPSLPYFPHVIIFFSGVKAIVHHSTSTQSNQPLPERTDSSPDSRTTSPFTTWPSSPYSALFSDFVKYSVT